MSALSETAESIATVALAYMNASNMIHPEQMVNPVDALDFACNDAIENYRMADKREGRYEYTLTTAELETIGFRASVANDILNGNVERPSTGNVRRYALKAMAGEL